MGSISAKGFLRRSLPVLLALVLAGFGAPGRAEAADDGRPVVASASASHEVQVAQTVEPIDEAEAPVAEQPLAVVNFTDSLLAQQVDGVFGSRAPPFVSA